MRHHSFGTHPHPTTSAGWCSWVQSRPSLAQVPEAQARADEISQMSSFTKGNRLRVQPRAPGQSPELSLGAGAAWAHPAPRAAECSSQALSPESSEVQTAAGAEEQEGAVSGTRDQHNPPYEQRLCPYHFFVVYQEEFCCPVFEGHSNITKQKPTETLTKCSNPEPKSCFFC